jgi:hypothetical protein
MRICNLHGIAWGAKFCRHCGKPTRSLSSIFIDKRKLILITSCLILLGLGIIPSKSVIVSCNKRSLVEQQKRQTILDSLPGDWKSAYYAMLDVSDVQSKLKILTEFHSRSNLNNLNPEQVEFIMSLFDCMGCDRTQIEAFKIINEYIE